MITSLCQVTAIRVSPRDPRYDVSLGSSPLLFSRLRPRISGFTGGQVGQDDGDGEVEEADMVPQTGDKGYPLI